ncbi:PREDICTED: putative UPF0481 protein At3g02645 [Tarenaya hassleriana]|uniref:putative UPF0481 protein At3g02645 n=1 Tax=Tarenaya hassleriana TaxID=28532 RepID=UPI00053C55DC|nr:PREDICTED: putative UPF0481 protein At3g02645 [Tarenaya hassleriana]
MLHLKQPFYVSSGQNFDEARWLVNVRQSLDADFEDDSEVLVCIFHVPKALMYSHPDCYTPQQVAIGPYHCLRPELYEMERYKLLAARRIQSRFKTFKFLHLSERLQEMEPKIRACYHKYVEFKGETLSWMMAVDASFLLEFLQTYNITKGKTLSRISSGMSHLVDNAGRRSGHNEILRDILMLENQIPLLVLRKTLELQLESVEAADDLLFSILTGLSRELSPLSTAEYLPSTRIQEYAHILDFMYQTIVPKMEEEELGIVGEDEEDGENDHGREKASPNSRLREFLREIKLRFKKVFESRPAGFILKLPWKILSNLPGFVVLKVSAGYLFTRQENEEGQGNSCPESSTDIEKPPLAEEITIPSVSELYKSGVRFRPTNGNISTISFDSNSGLFYLPVINLDVNTEIILRNLVAYEASNTCGPLVFTRYTELINGIVDSEDDVRLLREQGILMNRLKSDEEAANLWNGMSKSLRLTKVPFLDKTIEEVNRYFSGRWRVKVGNLVELYVYGSWRFLAFVAAVLVLLLFSLQVLSLVYNSTRLLRPGQGTMK